MADNLYTQAQDQDYIEQINQIFEAQKTAFAKQPYPELAQRKQALTLLKNSLLSHQQALIDALSQDFEHRSADDSKMGDILPTIMAIDYSLKQLKKWLKPSKRHVGLLFQPAKAHVMYQPLGVVGIITPWNYPVYLSLGPVITALAAGNRAMVKMSEFTPKTNEVIEQIASVLPKEQLCIVKGGPQVAAYFSEQAFDHLLFTGSTRVGKLVMAAAAKNLTPVTLELGGKSPTIIDDSIDINDAVSRFILGKTLNAGQTCVAPDYILCPEAKIDELVAACRHWFNKMYPDLETNPDYSHIINQGQFERLNTWLADAETKGAKVHRLAEASNNQRKIPLTLLTNVNPDMTLMQEEIFGPLLPVVSYQSLEQAIEYVNQGDRPLALYFCSHNNKNIEQVLKNTHAGGVCINDAAMHVAQEDLPFGGVGPSGMGQYHGYEGFLTFSKAKAVFAKGRINTATQAFPPYGKPIHKLIEFFYLRK